MGGSGANLLKSFDKVFSSGLNIDKKNVSFYPADTDAFLVIASLHLRSNVCEPKQPINFCDVRHY